MENEYEAFVESVNLPLQTYKAQLPKKIKEISEINIDTEKRNTVNMPLFGFFASLAFFLKNPRKHQSQKKSIDLFLVTCLGFCTIFGLYHFGYNNYTIDIIPTPNIVLFNNNINNITQSNVITRNVGMSVTLQETGMIKIDENRVNDVINNSHAMSLDNSPTFASIIVVEDNVNFNDGLNRFKEELDSVISFFTSLNSQTSESENFNMNVKEDDVENGVRRLECMSNTRIKIKRENVKGLIGMRLE
ncbi:hypothetical protein F8M41_000704 [Gigaspora margarita]|uniref:Uncharacterized protein n=1 Tax=Gigaspora margarita TaxID=4874 RepID=A0A8H3XIN1_GIGMA|nr:hypothetical protein F8M41_000704 [Gigaspora margarita]